VGLTAPKWLQQEIQNLDFRNTSLTTTEAMSKLHLETPIAHPDKDSCKQKLLPDGMIEHRLVFTCPFLFMGCKLVTFSSGEWSAHLGEHGIWAGPSHHIGSTTESALRLG
jgi:hypothetical protein